MDSENDFENNNILRIFISILDDFLDLIFKTYQIISKDYNFFRDHKNKIQFFRNHLPCPLMLKMIC